MTRAGRASGASIAFVALMTVTMLFLWPETASSVDRSKLKGAVYGGSATGGAAVQPRYPFSLELKSSGEALKSLFIYVESQPCVPSGQRIAYTVEIFDTPVRRSGEFSEQDSFTGPLGGGREVTTRYDVQGRVTNDLTKGKYRETHVVRDSSGAVIDECATGRLRWRATRQMSYGGTSSGKNPNQLYPFSLSETADGKKLDSFFIQWAADCEGRSLSRTLEHFNIGIDKRDRISDSGRFAFVLPSGAQVKGQYTLSGEVKGEEAAGTYRATGTATTASGQTLQCDSGRVKWEARMG